MALRQSSIRRSLPELWTKLSHSVDPGDTELDWTYGHHLWHSLLESWHLCRCVLSHGPLFHTNKQGTVLLIMPKIQEIFLKSPLTNSCLCYKPLIQSDNRGLGRISPWCRHVVASCPLPQLHLIWGSSCTDHIYSQLKLKHADILSWNYDHIYSQLN